MSNEDQSDLTLNYYEENANEIYQSYDQGYQIALIKSEKHKKSSLQKQNFYYLCELLDLKPDDFIADLGCGNGQFYKFLSTTSKYKRCRYMGVDLSESQIQNAKKRNKNNPDPNFMHLDMNKFFSHEPYFDAYFFLESIGYTNKLDILVKSISTGLKIGGKVVIKNPIKILNDVDKDKEFEEKFLSIQREYGYADDSIGMLPSKQYIEEVFLKNGFKLEKFETPDYDVETYNTAFLNNESFKKSHPNYVKHITEKKYENYAPNVYLECAIFVFEKVEDVVMETTSLPYVRQMYDQYTQDEPMDKVIQRSIAERGVDIMDPGLLEMYQKNPEAASAVIEQSISTENNDTNMGYE
jgi:SAM-dependent methyltransferase